MTWWKFIAKDSECAKNIKRTKFALSLPCTLKNLGVNVKAILCQCQRKLYIIWKSMACNVKISGKLSPIICKHRTTMQYQIIYSICISKNVIRFRIILIMKFQLIQVCWYKNIRMYFGFNPISALVLWSYLSKKRQCHMIWIFNE